MTSPLPLLEIGELQTLPSGFGDQIASVAYDKSRPIAIAHPQTRTVAASQMLDALALQLLRLDLETGATVALFEPQPSAQFGQLKRLFARTGQSYGQQLVGDAAYHTHLHKLIELAHKRFALLANLNVSDIDEYNAHKSVRRKEPWQLLLVSAVLAQSGRDGDLAQLQTLCTEGPKVGILPLLLRGPAEAEEHEQGYNRKPLRAFWSVVAPRCFGFDWHQMPPAPINQFAEYWRLFNRFGVQIGVPAHHCHQWVDELCAAQLGKVQAVERPDFLSVPIGTRDNVPIRFALGSETNAFNALVSGDSDSGKTTFLQHLILSICENYTPEQIQLVLLDYGTVSFGPYKNVAHVQAVLEQPKNGEQINRMLDFLSLELDRRKDSFKVCGEQNDVVVDDRTSYEQYSGIALPTILLMIDEFGSLMDRGNTTSSHVGNQPLRVSVHAEALINLLAREGRKAGLHVIVITQTFRTVDRMPQDLKSNPHAALGLKASAAADSRAIFNSENDAACHLLPRQAVLNVDGGKSESNVIVDMDDVPKDLITLRQKALKQKWRKTEESALEQYLSAATSLQSAHSARAINAQPTWLRGGNS